MPRVSPSVRRTPAFPVRALGVALALGARVDVVLIDGVRNRLEVALRDLGEPPAQLQVPRPAGCQLLDADADPAFVTFELTADTDPRGRPVYRQVV